MLSTVGAGKLHVSEHGSGVQGPAEVVWKNDLEKSKEKGQGCCRSI